MTTTSAPTRDELRAHLVASRIAGRVATSRDNNLTNFGRCSARDPMYTFGLEYGAEWTPAAVLALMAERVGVSSDATFTDGVDTIDPDLTIAALDRMANRLRRAAQHQERVLVATGHPDGVYAIHTEVARRLADRGATMLSPAEGRSYPGASGNAIRHVGGVAVVVSGSAPQHTHSPYPMQVMLAALAEAGEPPPDLVVADHGYAGAAGEAGIDAVGYADCNDPALFIGEALGKVVATVPLDDNVLPRLYAPLTAYLLAGMG